MVQVRPPLAAQPLWSAATWRRFPRSFATRARQPKREEQSDGPAVPIHSCETRGDLLFEVLKTQTFDGSLPQFTRSTLDQNRLLLAQSRFTVLLHPCQQFGLICQTERLDGFLEFRHCPHGPRVFLPLLSSTFTSQPGTPFQEATIRFPEASAVRAGFLSARVPGSVVALRAPGGGS